jgi:transcriptional regulator with XRE-family HTH domain
MFGKWVKAERDRRGWSQSETARRAGITSQAVNQLERGKVRSPNAETAAGFARAFGMTESEMYQAAYGNAVTETIGQLQGEGVPADVLTELEQAAPDLSPTQWGIVVAVVRDMAGRKPTRRPQRAQRAESPTEPEQEDDGREHRASARGLSRMRV